MGTVCLIAKFGGFRKRGDPKYSTLNSRILIIRTPDIVP